MEIYGAILEETGRSRPYAASKPISISMISLDAPKEHELLVRIEAAGICHSDLSVVNGNRQRPTPLLLGHEAAGIVLEVGSAVADIHIGDRIVMTFTPRCNECEACATGGRFSCVRGAQSNTAGELLAGGSRLKRGGELIYHHLGVSGFATHAVVDRRSVVRVDLDIPPVIAALLGCAVLTGGGPLLNAAPPRDGEAIAVVGLGGVGLASLITAISLSSGPVYGIDNNEDKLARAKELGATEVFNANSVVATGFRAPLVIEAAGAGRAFELALEITAPGGRTVTVGLPAPTDLATISPLKLVAEGRTIIGSYLGSSVPERDIPILADLWRSGKLPIESLVSSTIAIEEINEGMDHLADGKALRQMISF